MPIFNKLVRDRVPEILKRKKVKHKARTASESEFRELLAEKFREETQEFLEKPSLEELADIAEVLLAVAEQDGPSTTEFKSCMASLRALCASIGRTPVELEECRLAKLHERGGFLNRIVLVSTE